MYGGLLYVMQEIEVKNVIIGKQFENSENLQEFQKIVKDKNIKVNVVEAGVKINIEKGLYFDVFWPDTKHVISEKSLNNNALSCKLIYNNFTMLFTGDIEEVAEKEIVNIYKNSEILKSTVLKVAHHGSKSSTTEDFLKAVKPQIAVIGVGKNNLYGHPNAEVLKRLESLRCKSLSYRPNGRNSNNSK